LVATVARPESGATQPVRAREITPDTGSYPVF
jgi:hypothetical protein